MMQRKSEGREDSSPETIPTVKSKFRPAWKILGSTLPELMVTVGVGSIVSLGASSLFVWAIDQFNVIVDRNLAEENLLWASFHVRSHLQQAVALDVVNTQAEVRATPVAGGPAAPAPQNPQGHILRAYDSARAAGGAGGGAVNGTVDLISRFWRENGVRNGALAESAIFFERPNNTTAPFQRPGRLFLTTAQGGGPVGPGLSDIWFDRIVEVRVNTLASLAPDNRAKSAQIKLIARYFVKNDKARWAWCPSSRPSGPQADEFMGSTTGCLMQGYKDLEFDVNVVFRNNLLTRASASGVPGGDRVLGNLYFYKTIMPIINN